MEPFQLREVDVTISQIERKVLWRAIGFAFQQVLLFGGISVNHADDGWDSQFSAVWQGLAGTDVTEKEDGGRVIAFDLPPKLAIKVFRSPLRELSAPGCGLDPVLGGQGKIHFRMADNTTSGDLRM